MKKKKAAVCVVLAAAGMLVLPGDGSCFRLHATAAGSVIQRTEDADSQRAEDVNSQRTGDADSQRTGDADSQIAEDVNSQGAEDADSQRTGDADSQGVEDVRDWENEAMDIENETEDLLSELDFSDIDAYLQQEDMGQVTFSGLVKDLARNGLSLEFSSLGEKLKQVVLADYRENRTVLIQILILALAFSILLQMTSSLQKKYISDLGFLGVYLILMMLLLRLFLLMTGTVENFFAKLVDFMRMLQPAFCMSMVFSSGSISAGAYYQLLLLLIYLIDTVFAKILLPVVQAYMVLQLVNHMTEERFSRIAGLLADSVHWCVKIFTTALIGLNIVQGLLAPGIDGLKRSAAAGAVRAIPGAGQIVNSMTEILAGSAMLIKNSVGVAALVILIVTSFLPLVKTAVFMLLYRACAALMEPVADQRFCAAVAALGQSAALYLKLMFYAALLFFLTTAIICAATTLSV